MSVQICTREWRGASRIRRNNNFLWNWRRGWKCFSCLTSKLWTMYMLKLKAKKKKDKQMHSISSPNFPAFIYLKLIPGKIISSKHIWGREGWNGSRSCKNLLKKLFFLAFRFFLFFSWYGEIAYGILVGFRFSLLSDLCINNLEETVNALRGLMTRTEE